MRNERKVIECIIRINPLIYGLQDKIEQAQDALISDMALPAERVVRELIELDNRRVDLCNLVVLYGFIERGLGEDFPRFKSCVFAGERCDLHGAAALQIELAGYDATRCENEFGYLFKTLKPIAKRRTVAAVVPEMRFGTPRFVSGATD